MYMPNWMKPILAIAAAVSLSQAATLATVSGPDVLPAIDDQSAWSIADFGGLNVGIAQGRDREAETFSARIYKVDGNGLDASIVDRKPVTLVDGHRYTLTLLARADTPRDIRIVAATSKGHKSVGLDATVSIGFPYQAFNDTFIAHNPTGAPVQFSIGVGQTTGSVWIEDVQMVDEGPASLSQRST